jgi:tRNA1Val (adenine37-N6)-methyltransferase
MSREPEPHSESTLDPFLGGRLSFHQPKRGYRFSVDAPLLAGFVEVRPDDLVADLGAGCGVVGILLAHFYPFRRLVAVEVQDELAELARRNVRLNEFTSRVEVRHQDVAEFAAGEAAGRYDLVVSNPPFHPVGSTRSSTHRQRAVARQEILLDPIGLFTAAARLLRPGGRMGLVHRPWRWPELRRLMAERGLQPSRVRQVLPREGEEANLILVEAVNGEPAAVTEPEPLVIFRRPGLYTAEAEALLKGGRPLPR